MLTSLLAGLAIGSPSFWRVTPGQGVWRFTKDQGQSLWSFGVDCVDTGLSRNNYKDSNKAYASFRFFDNDQGWVKDTIGKLQKWGFNSTGGWSDDKLFRKYAASTRLPYFVVLHLGAYDQAPWHDLFAPQMEHWVNFAAKTQIPPIANDPYLVGYFSDNELGWWDDTLFISYLKMKPSAPGRKKLILTLRTFYKGDFSHLKREWVVKGNSFDQIQELHLRSGAEGRRAVNAWTQTIGERYYSLMRNSIRKFDKQHLILGDRYCQYYTLPIVRASKKYVDVVSTNFGADWNDGSITPFFLRTLHSVTDKPVIVTEFYMAATENRSGNKNSGTAFPVVKTQTERAEAFGKYVRSLASLPYVVGAHWFQYYDEPANGRGDGEDFNMGLVDTDGRPYEELTKVAANMDLHSRRARAAEILPKFTVQVPLVKNLPTTSLRDWPRQAGVLSASAGTPFADIFTAQDTQYLYLGLYAMDYIDESLYAGGHISDVDRARWEFKFAGDSKPIVVRFGGKGLKASVNEPKIEITEAPGLKFSVMLKVPKSILPMSGSVRFQSALDTHGRGEHMAWKGVLKGLSK